VHPLVEYFSQQLCDEVPSIIKRPFGDAAQRALATYPWPGNVRELKFAVERALCVAQGDWVEPGDLPPEVVGGEGVPAPVEGDFDGQVNGFELGLLKRAMDGVGGSQKEAAKALGLSYDRFRHLLRKHGLIKK